MNNYDLCEYIIVRELTCWVTLYTACSFTLVEAKIIQLISELVDFQKHFIASGILAVILGGPGWSLNISDNREISTLKSLNKNIFHAICARRGMMHGFKWIQDLQQCYLAVGSWSLIYS